MIAFIRDCIIFTKVLSTHLYTLRNFGLRLLRLLNNCRVYIFTRLKSRKPKFCHVAQLPNIKVSKSQKHFFLKFHCPLPIGQNSALWALAEFCQIFRSFFGQWSFKKNSFEKNSFGKNSFEIYWPLLLT